MEFSYRGAVSSTHEWRACWLNTEQFVLNDSGGARYYLVQAQGATAAQATLVAVQEQFPTEEDLKQLQARWRAAEQIYVLDTFGTAAYTVRAVSCFND
jgi:hypothetical protein